MMPTGSQGDPPSFDGDFRIVNDVYERMNKVASSQPGREIGGMLFGNFDDSGDHLVVDVEKVVHLQEQSYSNSRTYFEIEPEAARKVIDKYTPEWTYLGNWHSHLGYGGPSEGDRQQVVDFFSNNETRDLLISVIMDRKQRGGAGRTPSYEPIIEIYERQGENETAFDTWRVKRNDIQFLDGPNRDVSASGNREDDGSEDPLHDRIDSFDLDESLQERLHSLVQRVDDTVDLGSPLSRGTVYRYDGSQTDEIVIAFPFSHTVIERRNVTRSQLDLWDLLFDSDNRQVRSNVPVSLKTFRDLVGGPRRVEQKQTIDAYLSVSVPLSYPDKDIYVDVATRDFEKQLTIHKVGSQILSDDIEGFVDDIDYAVNEHIPEMLKSPLATVLQDNVEWSA